MSHKYTLLYSRFEGQSKSYICSFYYGLPSRVRLFECFPPPLPFPSLPITPPPPDHGSPPPYTFQTYTHADDLGVVFYIFWASQTVSRYLMDGILVYPKATHGFVHLSIYLSIYFSACSWLVPYGAGVIRDMCIKQIYI